MKEEILQCLKCFIKIKHNLVPNYLLDLLPAHRHETMQYALRNNNRIEPPFARLETFKRSFIPFSIRLWNSTPEDVKNADSFNKFKSLISSTSSKNPLYYYGKRWSNIHHARLRLGCSGLNYDLFNNLHVVTTPFCSCGIRVNETAYHYLMVCRKYITEREDMKNKIMPLTEFKFQTLLHGDNNLNYQDNCSIFDAVHTFMCNTSRFR